MNLGCCRPSGFTAPAITRAEGPRPPKIGRPVGFTVGSCFDQQGTPLWTAVFLTKRGRCHCLLPAAQARRLSARDPPMTFRTPRHAQYTDCGQGPRSCIPRFLRAEGFPNDQVSRQKEPPCPFMAYLLARAQRIQGGATSAPSSLGICFGAASWAKGLPQVRREDVKGLSEQAAIAYLKQVP